MVSLSTFVLSQSAADFWQGTFTDLTPVSARDIVLRARPQLGQKLQTHGLFRLPGRSDCRQLGSDLNTSVTHNPQFVATVEDLHGLPSMEGAGVNGPLFLLGQALQGPA